MHEQLSSALRALQVSANSVHLAVKNDDPHIVILASRKYRQEMSTYLSLVTAVSNVFEAHTALEEGASIMEKVETRLTNYLSDLEAA